jgi:hypothetical protein
MFPLPLTPAVPDAGEPLCRAGGHTCAACCYGGRVSRRTLETRLRRQTHLFARLVGDRPTSGRLLAFELAVRRGAGLIWAALLGLPLIGGLVRPWLKEQAVCAFLGFEDEAGTRVGCLLHPSRWQGRDVRVVAAFAFWKGFGCGQADYLCLSGWRFARASWRARRDFLRRTRGLDWFDHGQAVGGFGSGREGERRPEEASAKDSVP